MSNVSRFILGGKPLPLDLASALSAEAAAEPGAAGPIRFDFTYRLVPITCQLDEMGDHARLRLAGLVGPMPFSAQSPAARAALARIVAEAAPRLQVEDGRIVLVGELRLPLPVAADSLVAALATFLIPAAPYLELISAYLRLPGEPRKPGEPALRPQWRGRGASVWGR
jgi:hypothetical protein